MGPEDNIATICRAHNPPSEGHQMIIPRTFMTGDDSAGGVNKDEGMTNRSQKSSQDKDSFPSDLHSKSKCFSWIYSNWNLVRYYWSNVFPSSVSGS